MRSPLRGELLQPVPARHDRRAATRRAGAPILTDTTSGEQRAARLALAKLTSRALVLGLDLLGIEAPEKLQVPERKQP